MEKERVDITEFLRKVLLKFDIFFHIVAAILLLTACAMTTYSGILSILNFSRDSVIHLVNDVLLALIILELLWTVIRFLKKQKFVLAPFLAIGIIAAVRRILLVEAQASYLEHTPMEKLYEIGLISLVVIILVVAYYITIKAQGLEQ